ncbi:replicative DNA helicase [Candidatus Woesearchaeota archaeon]|nr:replicative DNA helicase [Candidatus Woesearchaeota archaeon]MBW3018457.1 replicative DNA helicase [Candidatus Woesearchaeota archaeon]
MGEGFQTTELEQGILVGFVHNLEQTVGAMAQMHSLDFFDQRHRTIFEVVKELFSREGKIDSLTVAAALAGAGMDPEEYAFLEHPKYQSQRGMDFKLARTYAEKLRTYSTNRLLCEKTEELRRAAEEGELKPEELIQLGQRSMEDVTEHFITGFGGVVQLQTSLVESMKTIEALCEGDEKPRDRIFTGFEDWDDEMGGLYPELIVFASRPYNGAKEFAMNLAHRVANKGKDEKLSVLYFLTNEDKITFTNKLLSMTARIDYKLIRGAANMQRRALNKLADAATDLVGLNLYIDDSPKLNLEKVIALSRHFKNKNLGLVVVDDVLGLRADVAYRTPHVLEGDNPRFYDDVTERLNVIAVGLDRLARELNVPVIAVTGCSSDVEKVKAAIPRLRHVTGPQFQQLGKTIVLFNRPRVYEEGDDNGFPSDNVYLRAFHRRGRSPSRNITVIYFPDMFRFDSVSNRSADRDDEDSLI